MKVLIKYFKQSGFSWRGHFYERGSMFKTRAVSVTGTCFEGNVLGWDSMGTRLSTLWANLMSKTDILKVLSNISPCCGIWTQF